MLMDKRFYPGQKHYINSLFEKVTNSNVARNQIVPV